MLESSSRHAEGQGVAGELVTLLRRLGEQVPLPRVRALHVPPASVVWRKRSAFCAIELDEGTSGLSYISLGDTHQRLLNDAGVSAGPSGADALHVASALRSDDEVRRTIALATINAVTRWFFDRTGLEPDLDGDALAGIGAEAGDHVGMVGLFEPLVGPVLGSGAQLTVLELDPQLAGIREGYEVTLERTEVSACNKVLCTSTVLLNDTLDAVVKACPQAQHFVLIGPGAACLPDPLFARGVTALGGAWVRDAQALIEALRAGQSWGRFTAKFELRERTYPGLADLLQRL